MIFRFETSTPRVEYVVDQQAELDPPWQMYVNQNRSFPGLSS